MVPCLYGRVTINWRCVPDPVAGQTKPGEETEDMPRFQLYDLAADIGETTNIIEKHQEIAQELRAILKAHVLRGRSTPGPEQKNDGVQVWKTISWIEE